MLEQVDTKLQILCHSRSSKVGKDEIQNHFVNDKNSLRYNIYKKVIVNPTKKLKGKTNVLEENSVP